jgi:hypothetical protein
MSHRPVTSQPIYTSLPRELEVLPQTRLIGRCRDHAPSTHRLIVQPRRDTRRCVSTFGKKPIEAIARAADRCV